jgi:hypothetical protein
MYRLSNFNRMPFMTSAPEPLTPDSRTTSLGRRLNGEPLPKPQNASSGLSDIILKACAFRRQDRFASAAEMKMALMGLENCDVTEWTSALVKAENTREPSIELPEEAATLPLSSGSSLDASLNSASISEDLSKESEIDAARTSKPIKIARPSHSSSRQIYLAAVGFILAICAIIYIAPKLQMGPAKTASGAQEEYIPEGELYPKSEYLSLLDQYFGPYDYGIEDSNEPISRVEAINALGEVLKANGGETPEDANAILNAYFLDASFIPDWARGNIAIAAYAGVLKKMNGAFFSPDDWMTQEDANFAAYYCQAAIRLGRV